MCDEEAYHRLREKFETLDARVTKLETSLTDMRTEVRQGFADIKAELLRVYDERSAWGTWARDNAARAIKWGGAIILAACGINQLGTIVKLVQGAQP